MSNNYNEGDIIEGIFSIALALYIAHGSIEKSKLNAIRAKIDTKMATSGSFTYTVAEKIKRTRANGVPDVFNVSITMRLKKSATLAFGSVFNEMYYSKSSDIGKINSKIDQLITGLNTSAFKTKIDKAINNFLGDNVGQRVTFTIVCDGISSQTESVDTKGKIKGDVFLVVNASTDKIKNKKIFENLVSFSLKTSNSTVAELSPYKSMLIIAEKFGVPWKDETLYTDASKRVSAKAKKTASLVSISREKKDKLLLKMFTELKRNITKKAKEDNKKFTEASFDLIEYNMFGTDLSDLVDITDIHLKEITHEHFTSLRAVIPSIQVESTANYINFINKKNKKLLFKIKLEIQKSKLLIQTGSEIYKK